MCAYSWCLLVRAIAKKCSGQTPLCPTLLRLLSDFFLKYAFNLQTKTIADTNIYHIGYLKALGLKTVLIRFYLLFGKKTKSLKKYKYAVLNENNLITLKIKLK